MEKETKYISVEVNEGVHFKALSDVLNFLFRLSQELHKRMKDMEVVGRTLTVKLTVKRSSTLRDPTSANGKLHNDQIRSVRLPHETGDLGVIRRECKNLLLQMHVSPADITGVGVQVSRLQSISGSSKFCKTLKEWHGVKTDVARDNAAGKNPSSDLTTGNKGRKSYSLLDYIKPKKREIQSHLSSSPDKKKSEETRTAVVPEESYLSMQTGKVKCDDKNISNKELMKDIDKAHTGNVATVTDSVTAHLNDKCSNKKTVSIKQEHLIPSPPQQCPKGNVTAVNLDHERFEDVSVGGVKSRLAHGASEDQNLGGHQTFTDRHTMNDSGAAGSARRNSQGEHSKRSKTHSESTSVNVIQNCQSSDVAMYNNRFPDQECLSDTDKTTHFPAVKTKHSKDVLLHCQENHSGHLKSDPGIMTTSECLTRDRCSKSASQTEYRKQGEALEEKPDHTALVDAQHFESIENLIPHGNQTQLDESKKGSDSTVGVCLPDGNCKKDMIQYGKHEHPSGSDEISHSTPLVNAKVGDCSDNGNQNTSGGSQKDSNGTAMEHVPHVDCEKDGIQHGRQEHAGGSNETIYCALPLDTKVSCNKGVVHDDNQNLLGELQKDNNGTTIEHVPHVDCKKDEIQYCKQKHAVGSNETIYSTQPMDAKVGDCSKGVIHGSHEQLPGESQEDSNGTTMEHVPHVGCEMDEIQHGKQKCASGSIDSSGNTTLMHTPSFDCAKIAAHHGSKHSSGSNSSTDNTLPLHALEGEDGNTVTHRSKPRDLGGSEKSTAGVAKAHTPQKGIQHWYQKHPGEQNQSTEKIWQTLPQCGDGINVTMHHHDGLHSSKSPKNTNHIQPLQPPHCEVKTSVTHYNIQRHSVGPEKSTQSTHSTAVHDCNTDTIKHGNHKESCGQRISPGTTTVEHISLGDCSEDVCQKSSSRITASTDSSELDHALYGKFHKDVINQGKQDGSTGSKKKCDSASVAHASPPDHTKSLIHQKSSRGRTTSTDSSELEHFLHGKCHKDVINQGKHDGSTGPKKKCDSTPVAHASPPDHRRSLIHQKSSRGRTTSTDSSELEHVLHGKCHTDVINQGKHDGSTGPKKKCDSTPVAHASPPDHRKSLIHQKSSRGRTTSTDSSELEHVLHGKCHKDVINQGNHNCSTGSKTKCDSASVSHASPPDHKTSVIHYGNYGHSCGSEKSVESSLKAHAPRGGCRKDGYQKHQGGQSKCTESFSQVLAQPDNGTNIMTKDGHRVQSRRQRMSPNSTAMAHVSHGNCRKDVSQKSPSRMQMSINRSDREYVPHGSCRKDVIHQSDKKCPSGSKNCDSTAASHATDVDHRKSVNSHKQKRSVGSPKKSDRTPLAYFSRRGCNKDVTMHENQGQSCRSTKSFDSDDLIKRGTQKHSSGSKRSAGNPLSVHDQHFTCRKDAILLGKRRLSCEGIHKSSHGRKLSVDSSNLVHAQRGNYSEDMIHKDNWKHLVGSRKTWDSTALTNALCGDYHKKIVQHGNLKISDGSTKSSSALRRRSSLDCRKGVSHSNDKRMNTFKILGGTTLPCASCDDFSKKVFYHDNQKYSGGSKITSVSMALANVSCRACRKNVEIADQNHLQVAKAYNKPTGSTAVAHASDVIHHGKLRHTIGSKKDSDSPAMTHITSDGGGNIVTQFGILTHSSESKKNPDMTRTPNCDDHKDLIHSGDLTHSDGPMKTAGKVRIAHVPRSGRTKDRNHHDKVNYTSGSNKNTHSSTETHRDSGGDHKDLVHSGDVTHSDFSIKTTGKVRIAHVPRRGCSKDRIQYDKLKHISESKKNPQRSTETHGDSGGDHKDLVYSGDLIHSNFSMKTTGKARIAHVPRSGRSKDRIYHDKLKHTSESKKDFHHTLETLGDSGGDHKDLVHSGDVTHSDFLTKTGTRKVRIAHVPRRGCSKDRTHHDKLKLTSESKKDSHNPIETHGDSIGDHKDLVHSSDLTHSDFSIKTTRKVRIAHVPRRGCSKDRIHHDKLKLTSESKKNSLNTIKTHGDSVGDHKDLVHSGDLTHSDFSIKTTRKVRIAHVPRHGCSKDRTHHDKLKPTSESKKNPHSSSETHGDSIGDHKDLVHSGDLTHSDFSIKTTRKVRIAHVPRRGCSKDRTHHDKLKLTSESKKNPHSSSETHGDSIGDHKDLVHSGDLTHSDFSIKTTRKVRIAHVPRSGCSKDRIHHEKLKPTGESKKNPHSSSETHGDSGGNHKDLVFSRDLADLDFSTKTTRKVRIAHVPRRGFSKDRIYHGKLKLTSESKKNPLNTIETHGDSGGDHKDLIHSHDLKCLYIPMKTSRRVRFAHVTRSDCSQRRNHHDKLDHNRKSENNPYSTIETHVASDGSSKDAIHSGDLELSDRSNRNTGSKTMPHVPSDESKDMICCDKLKHFSRSKIFDNTAKAHVPSNGGGNMIQHGDQKHSSTSNNNFGNTEVVHVQCSGDSNDVVHHGKRKCSGGSKKSTESKTVTHAPSSGFSKDMIYCSDLKHSGRSEKSSDRKTLSHAPNDNFTKDVFHHGDLKYMVGSNKTIDGNTLPLIPNSNCKEDEVHIMAQPDGSTEGIKNLSLDATHDGDSIHAGVSEKNINTCKTDQPTELPIMKKVDAEKCQNHPNGFPNGIENVLPTRNHSGNKSVWIPVKENKSEASATGNPKTRPKLQSGSSVKQESGNPSPEGITGNDYIKEVLPLLGSDLKDDGPMTCSSNRSSKACDTSWTECGESELDSQRYQQKAGSQSSAGSVKTEKKRENLQNESTSHFGFKDGFNPDESQVDPYEPSTFDSKNRNEREGKGLSEESIFISSQDKLDLQRLPTESNVQQVSDYNNSICGSRIVSSPNKIGLDSCGEGPRSTNVPGNKENENHDGGSVTTSLAVTSSQKTFLKYTCKSEPRDGFNPESCSIASTVSATSHQDTKHQEGINSTAGTKPSTNCGSLSQKGLPCTNSQFVKSRTSQGKAAQRVYLNVNDYIGSQTCAKSLAKDDSSSNGLKRSSPQRDSSETNRKDTGLAMYSSPAKKTRHAWHVVDPNFISDFYSKSSFHHLSTWRVEHKVFVNNLQKVQKKFPGKEKLQMLMDASKRKVNAGEMEKNAAKCEVITAEREINTTKTEVGAAEKKMNATKLEVDAAERDMNSAKQEVNAAERDMNSAKQEVNAAERDMNSAKQEMNADEREMDETKGEVNAAKREVNAPENEMNTATMEGNPSEREELQENQKPRVPSGYALPSTHMVIQERGINCTKMFGERSMIMHIDMDCFFVSVSLLNYPELRGMAVAVTGRPKVKVSQKTDSWSEDFEPAHLERRKWTSSQAKSLKMIPRGENSQQNSTLKEGIAGVTSDQELGDGKIGIGEENLVSGKRNADDKQDSSNSSDGEEVVDENSNDGTDIGEEKTSDAGDVLSDVKLNISVGTDEPCNPVAEVASCSYEARAYGVQKGMQLSKAKELCPHLLTVPYDFESYYRVSRILYETVASFTNEIEAISCDDMFVDITKILKDTGATPFQFAQLVVDEIFAKTQCTASVGIASNPLLAKLCIRIAKPNGIYVLEDHQVDEFMRNVPVKSLPGVGLATNQKLASLGITKCSELQELSLASLQSRFGQRLGQDLYQNCRGQSDHAIKVEREVKVVSSTVNFGIRFSSNAEAEQFVADLAQVVHRKLKKTGMAGRSIVLKMKIRRSDSPKYANDFLGHGLCDNKCRTKTLKQETDDLSVIQRECQNLFLLMRAPAKDIRGVGVLIMRLKKASASSDCTQSLKDMLVKKGSSSAKTSELGKTLAAVPRSPGLAKKNSEVKKPPQSVTKKTDKKRSAQYPILEMFSTITKKQSQVTGRESTTQSPVETEANRSDSANCPGKRDMPSPVIKQEPRSPSVTEREVNQRSLPENFRDKSDSVSLMIKQEPRSQSSDSEGEVNESSDTVNFPEETVNLSSVIMQESKSKSVIESEVTQSSLSVNCEDESDILSPFTMQERKSPSVTEGEANQRTLSVNFPEKSDRLSLILKKEPVLSTVVESEVAQCSPFENLADRSDTPPPVRRQEPNSQSSCDSEENPISPPVNHPDKSDVLSQVIKQEPMSPSAADSEVNQSHLTVSLSDNSVVPFAVIKQEPTSPTVVRSEANRNCSPVDFPDERDQSTISASPPSTPNGTLEPFLRPVSMFGPVPNRSFKRALSTGDMPSEYPANLDPDVLKELPPHIREEVLEEERLKATKSGNLVGALGHVEELPSFSNIDPTCMDALPKEVQGELIAAYRKKGTLTFQETAKRSPERTPEKRAFQEESKAPEGIKRKKCSKSRTQSVSHSGKTSVQRKLFEVMNIHPSKDKHRRHSVL